MYINGAANLYFNTGAEYIGAAQKYQTVAQPARIAVASAPRLLQEAVKTTATDLPNAQHHYIYLISKNGIYKKDLRLANLPNESKEMQSFFYLYQQVMGALRNAQVKDRSNAGK